MLEFLTARYRQFPVDQTQQYFAPGGFIGWRKRTRRRYVQNAITLTSLWDNTKTFLSSTLINDNNIISISNNKKQPTIVIPTGKTLWRTLRTELRECTSRNVHRTTNTNGSNVTKQLVSLLQFTIAQRLRKCSDIIQSLTNISVSLPIFRLLLVCSWRDWKTHPGHICAEQ